MNQLVAGILASVDAGKTTLSEAMLYVSGEIRKLGRVDAKDAFLDHNKMERERGITIFSKQAMFNFSNTRITLLDTPGHIDFSAEMERTLQVLDAAILVISATDGVQSHTRTLWDLLKKYRIQVFLFINKMDQPDTDKTLILKKINQQLAGSCIDFTEQEETVLFENIAMCDEQVLDHFLKSGKISDEEIQELIWKRKLFPCYFGSALKVSGVEKFLTGIDRYSKVIRYSDEFGAKVFKIARDEQGNRLTYLKITGGKLKVKDIIGEEKVNQIRVYSGEKFEIVQEVMAGMVCALTGLIKTHPGQGLGMEPESGNPILEPVLSYKIEILDDMDVLMLLPKLRQLEEEIPELQIAYKESEKEIHIKLMGEVQTEIIKRMVLERFGVKISFAEGNILYKETICNTVEGVGHFEPLRHYAEVHLKMEPGEPGSGLQFDTQCSEDVLDRNWQRLILTHLKEKEHMGVLTGSPITDMRITLINGRAHTKHTEGGDFRQATYRAIRQGLMQAYVRLLEPVYAYRLEIPDNMVGRAMNDIDKMYGTSAIESVTDGFTTLTGKAPVVTMRGYITEVISYSKGHGKLSCSMAGYEPCHNEEEILEGVTYDPEADLDNPTGSVFCTHGAGVIVPWDQVMDYAHLPCIIENSSENDESSELTLEEQAIREKQKRERMRDMSSLQQTIDLEEIDSILQRTFYANKKSQPISHKGISAKRKVTAAEKNRTADSTTRVYQPSPKKDKYLLVDGYNVIFAWKELKELADINIDGARGQLMDILSNYQSIKGCNLILVFDAYRIQGHKTEILTYQNIHVVYTKEAETADQYIERFTHENAKNYDITVATSDGLEQIIIRGQGCQLISSRELEVEIRKTLEEFRERFLY